MSKPSVVEVWQDMAESYLGWAKEVEDYLADNSPSHPVLGFLIHYKQILTNKADKCLEHVEAELRKLEAA